MSHDWQTQKAETFQTFKQGVRGVKVPKEAVVVFYFLAEELKPQWAPAEHGDRRTRLLSSPQLVAAHAHVL